MNMNVQAKFDCAISFRNQEVKYVNIGLIQFAYRMMGPVGYCEIDQRPVILFIHGWPLNGLTYEHIINCLSKEFICIAVDLAGLGNTNWNDQVDLSPKGQAMLLSQFMKTLNIKAYAIYGNDSGGMIGRYLAEMDRDRITHLMLSNTEVPNERPPWLPFYKLCMRLPGFPFVMRQFLAIKTFVRSPMAFGGVFNDKVHLEGVFDGDFVQPLLISNTAYSNSMASFMQVFNWQQLDELTSVHPNLSMPTLFI